MYKRCAALLALLCTLTASVALAQMSPSWDIENREIKEANTSQAISLLESRQLDRALASLRRATIHAPRDPAPLAITGIALAMAGRYAEAIDSLLKAYSMQPTTETLLSAGIVYYLQHNYDAAIAAWNRILQANPKLCQVYGNIGMASLRKGDLKQAQDSFQRLVTCAPHSQLGYQGLAFTNYMAGKLTVAQEAAEHAESIQTYPPTVLLLANIDYLQGNRSRAIQRARQYTAMVRKRWLERSMTELGYSGQVDFHWDPYLSDSFDNGLLLQARMEAKEYMRQYYNQEGKLKRALYNARREQSRAPSDLMLYHQVGLLNLAQGDYSTAAEQFKAVMQHCPSCSVDLLYLGRSLALDGKAEQASQAIRTFQQVEPNQDIASHFSEFAKVDPAMQLESQTRKRIERYEKVGPKPIPSTRF